jgi:hypothetical protein
MFSRASCRRCGLSAVLISVFLHSLGPTRKSQGCHPVPLDFIEKNRSLLLLPTQAPTLQMPNGARRLALLFEADVAACITP